MMSKWGATVRGIIAVNDRILTARRAPTKSSYPGIYELPGGWVEFGEGLEIALIREFREELNLTVRVSGIVAARTAIVEGCCIVELHYWVEPLQPLARIVLDRRDHSALRWWTYQDFLREWQTDHPDYLAMVQAFDELCRARSNSPKITTTAGPAAACFGAD
jgi:8-oxo-dGTP pyrophosphatase MutT (NUDIX family)